MHPAYVPWAFPKPTARSESRRHGMSTRKMKALKTKQCKFYKKDGRCPQGNLCTFIHDSQPFKDPNPSRSLPRKTQLTPLKLPLNHAPRLMRSETYTLSRGESLGVVL
ncbi:hypothetical protein BJV77DRAFT_55573 [Russula vinacea]|nr:hypothetical protein BJV77DRAFT_55573 [Russula vinacea]